MSRVVLAAVTRGSLVDLAVRKRLPLCTGMIRGQRRRPGRGVGGRECSNAAGVCVALANLQHSRHVLAYAGADQHTTASLQHGESRELGAWGTLQQSICVHGLHVPPGVPGTGFAALCCKGTVRVLTTQH